MAIQPQAGATALNPPCNLQHHRGAAAGPFVLAHSTRAMPKKGALLEEGSDQSLLLFATGAHQKAHPACQKVARAGDNEQARSPSHSHTLPSTLVACPAYSLASRDLLQEADTHSYTPQSTSQNGRACLQALRNMTTLAQQASVLSAPPPRMLRAAERCTHTRLPHVSASRAHDKLRPQQLKLKPDRTATNACAMPACAVGTGSTVVPCRKQPVHQHSLIKLLPPKPPRARCIAHKRDG